MIKFFKFYKSKIIEFFSINYLFFFSFIFFEILGTIILSASFLGVVSYFSEKPINILNFIIIENSLQILLFVCINILFAIILKINTGESFLGGGDDKHFYNSALEIFHGMELVRSNHPLYHYINMLILNISYNLGLKDLSFVNLIIGNAFI